MAKGDEKGPESYHVDFMDVDVVGGIRTHYKGEKRPSAVQASSESIDLGSTIGAFVSVQGEFVVSVALDGVVECEEADLCLVRVKHFLCVIKFFVLPSKALEASFLGTGVL